MAFTDEDLKEMKEQMVQDLEWPTIFDVQGVLNLIDRLEAAERLINVDKSGPEWQEWYFVWRKAAGK